MGRNNLEQRTNDVNFGKNLTKGNIFKYEYLNENDCRLIEASQGLNLMQVQKAIRVNGKAEIEVNDRLLLKGETRKVNAIQPETDNEQQGRFKGSVFDFTGGMKVGLA